MEYNICRGLLGRGSWRHGVHRWKFSRLGGSRSVRIENHLWWIEMKTRREMHGERESERVQDERIPRKRGEGTQRDRKCKSVERKDFRHKSLSTSISRQEQV
ncbi:hypothetical protein MHYP_G00132990 [Metynnis hypsauchen]